MNAGLNPHVAPDDAGPKPNFTEREFRNTLGMFPTGVSVVTSIHAGEPIAATIGSFSSVSLEPPLVLFILAKNSKAYAAWASVKHFAVNVLDRSQGDISTKFAKALTDKWDKVAPLPGSVTDTLLLPGALAWLECETYSHHDGGDHLIVLGRVLALSHCTGANASPLVFYSGRYRSLLPIDEDNLPREETWWIHGW